MSTFVQRTKTSGHGPETVVGQQAYYVNGVYQYDIPYGVFGNADLRSLIGYDVVGFQKLRRSGAILPLSPWNQRETTWTNALTAFDLQTKSGTPSRWTSSVAGVPVWPEDPSDFSSNRDELSITAMARLYAGGWDALTFFAEFKQLVEMFKGLWARLLSLCKDFSYSELTGSWLLVRYGFRPLYYDIVSFTQMLSEINDKRQINKAQAGDSDTQSGTYTASFGAIEYDVNWETKFSERFSVFSKIAPPKILIDPILTAWELVRFSFIVDWFIDIGSWLAAMRGASVLSDVVGAYGTVTEFTASFSNARISNPSIYEGSCSITGSVARKVTVRDPSPVVLPLMPTLQFNMNWWKLADLIAIFKR